MSQSQKTPDQIAAAAKANAATYLATIPPEIHEPACCILEKYSGIAAEDVDAHIHDIPMTQDARFQNVAARLQAPESTETFLDVGCCLGHVIRHLIAIEVSSDRLHGTDLQPHFLDLGYELFRDCSPAKSKATFVSGDMLRDDDAGPDQLTGRIDRMAKFLRLGNPDAIIFGQNGGPKIVGWEKYVLDAEGWHSLRDKIAQNEIHGLLVDLGRIASLHQCVLGRREVDVSLHQVLDQIVSVSWQKNTTIASQIRGLKVDIESMGGESNFGIKKDLAEYLIGDVRKTLLQALQEEKTYRTLCRDDMDRQYWVVNQDAHGIGDKSWDNESYHNRNDVVPAVLEATRVHYYELQKVEHSIVVEKLVRDLEEMIVGHETVAEHEHDEHVEGVESTRGAADVESQHSELNCDTKRTLIVVAVFARAAVVAALVYLFISLGKGSH
ncbi:hypothetical protein B0T25DRAFT_567205 [Lasiosphaeria hispida]|uniref:Methyltransferase domain-containing protein n=1 Tax=Lasiosphaeria hispida TaxID=260671 RepID=A0AAJ0HND8_9PEZI|nr:hypothetical protein B0T25DRAFT_567205 [Lasiosphaeria hispida]